MEGGSKWSELQVESIPWKPERVAYGLNPSTLEDGAGKSLSFRLHNEINNNNNNKINKQRSQAEVAQWYRAHLAGARLQSQYPALQKKFQRGQEGQ